MNDTAAKGSMLIQIKSVTSKFATCYLTDGVDKITTVEVLETVLVQVMSIGSVIEIHRRGILNPVLVTSVLWNIQCTCNDGLRRTYAVLFLVEHERGNGLTGIGTVAGLTVNMNGSSANTELVLSARDGTRRRRHLIVVM